MLQGDLYCLPTSLVFDRTHVAVQHLLPKANSSEWETPRAALFLGGSQDLPGTAAEREELRKRFPNVVALPLDASFESLSQNANGAEIVHIAAHGARSSEDSLPGLKSTDGHLSGPLLAFLDLNSTGLVNLASCSSADPDFKLLQAVAQAGASRIIASLWAIEDRSSVEFNSSLYAEVSRGASPFMAFQKALESLRAHRPHPYYWGGLRFYGAP